MQSEFCSMLSAMQVFISIRLPTFWGFFQSQTETFSKWLKKLSHFGQSLWNLGWWKLLRRVLKQLRQMTEMSQKKKIVFSWIETICMHLFSSVHRHQTFLHAHPKQLIHIHSFFTHYLTLLYMNRRLQYSLVCCFIDFWFSVACKYQHLFSRQWCALCTITGQCDMNLFVDINI